MLLFRWILFKLMFMSGVVKIQANCPTWLHLTACHYHFATQCIPTPLAWYFHNLPGILLKLMVALTLYFEIPASFLILGPWKWLRLFAAGVQIFLQARRSTHTEMWSNPSCAQLYIQMHVVCAEFEILIIFQCNTHAST